MSTQDGDTVRTTPGPGGELPARLLAFLAGSAAAPAAPQSPAADPVLVRRLRARATCCAGSRVPEPRRGQATNR
ncbi:hypothetical protein [Geodermatophilus arenarius]|uniref:Uncharacterized protein n=1 Tax=Geodermatophilus arenarius TaxID=1137990 RepID=A0ABV9LDL9_9ACTN